MVGSEPRPPLSEGWHCCPSELSQDDAFLGAVVEVHRALHAQYFSGDPAVNPRLEVQARAFRRLEGWRVLLVLTPWMLARLLVPDRDPGLSLPEGWSAAARRDAPYQVLGPLLRLELLGQAQTAHLNYHPRLGHYLLMPLALDMAPYASPEAVFAAWDQVIQTRDANMEKHRRDCPWQTEVSRRELFRRFRTDS